VGFAGEEGMFPQTYLNDIKTGRDYKEKAPLKDEFK